MSNFRKQEYDEIFLKGLTNAFEEKLISKHEDFLKYVKNKEDIENFYVMLLSIHSEWLSEVYSEMENVYHATDLDLAEGVDLDHIGSWVGVPRVGATRSYVSLEFKLKKVPSEDVIYYKPLMVTTKDGKTYTTSENLRFNTGDNTCIVPAYSNIPGAYSKVLEDTLTSVVSDYDKSLLPGLSVSNLIASSGGEDGQSDDEYREYLKNWTKIKQKGNAWAYKYYFRNLDGLDSYHLIPLWDGTGTIKIVIDSSDSEKVQSLRNKIYNEIQENVALYDDDIQVVPAEKKLINVYLTVDVDIDRVNPYSSVEKKNIKSKIISSVKTFIDGGYCMDGSYYKGLVIGEDFIPYKLGVFIDKEVTEVKNITFTKENVPVTISDEEIGVSNTINIEIL